jgi:hypothetical protein
MSRYLVSLSVAFTCASALAQGTSKGGTLYEDRLAGDHLRLRTFVFGFMESDAGKDKKCAPPGTGLAVSRDQSGTLIVRFYDIPSLTEVKKDFDVKAGDGEFEKLWKRCEDSLVNNYTSYKIDRDELLTHDFKRSGVTFGGLLIPFKYRLSGDKGFVSSSTVAPYVGFRTRYLQTFGVSFTPILSAGVAFVPVRNPNGGTDPETKNAMSFAAGFVMTTSKDEKFNAGVVIGRDVLSDSDRRLDPNVNKPWLSFYIGFEM